MLSVHHNLQINLFIPIKNPAGRPDFFVVQEIPSDFLDNKTLWGNLLLTYDLKMISPVSESMLSIIASDSTCIPLPRMRLPPA